MWQVGKQHEILPMGASHTQILTQFSANIGRNSCLYLYLHHVLDFFFMPRSIRRILFWQKCDFVELDELFMNLNLEVQTYSFSYSHNSWCIHHHELLCTGRVGWIWERSSIEHSSLFNPLIKTYVWHQFQSIKFPLHSFFYWSCSLDSLEIMVSMFCFLEKVPF